MLMKLVVLACLLTVTCADERSCCFAPTFTMNGRFTTIVNETHEASPARNYNLTYGATFQAMVDFPNQKFAVIVNCEAEEDFPNKIVTTEGRKTLIIDGYRPIARLFEHWKYNVTSRSENRYIPEFCRITPVEHAERIPDYQCLPKQLLRGGDVKDDIIEMLPPQFLPPVLSDKLKIFFDQATCSPRRISFSPTLVLNSTKYRISFELETTTYGKLNNTDMPEIPRNVSVCTDAPQAITIQPVEKILEIIQNQLMLEGMLQ